MARELTPEQYQICRSAHRAGSAEHTGIAMTRAFTVVRVAAMHCSTPRPIDSGTGWPSFWQPYRPESITTRADTSHGMDA